MKRKGAWPLGSILVGAAAKLVPLLLLISSFDALVADPVSTLARYLPLTLLSAVLPLLFSSSLYETFNAAFVCLLAFVPGTYALIVIMGAPFTTHISETVLLSLHLAFMAFIDAIAQLGLNEKNWRPLLPAQDGLSEDAPHASEEKPAMERTGLEGALWGTFVGAYLGAVPIPLDWDRDWQRWPVTIYVGASLGLAIGSTFQSAYRLTYSQRIPSAKKQRKKIK